MLTEELNVVDCTVESLKAKLVSGLDGTLIDVREYPEFAAGHIPGALPIPLGRLRTRAREIDSSKPVYLVCRTGRRSAQACQELRHLGFDDVRNVTGGVTAWAAIGGELGRSAQPPWAIERQVRLVAGFLVLAGVLLSVWVSPWFVWLAGFVGAGLAFAALTDTCAMGSMLGRMPWNNPKRVR